MMISRDPLGLTPFQRLQGVLTDGLDAARKRQIDVTKLQREGRAELRAQLPRAELTLDAVLEKLGWSREYAEHFVQPYCTCECTRDGWEHCDHSIDLDLY